MLWKNNFHGVEKMAQSCSIVWKSGGKVVPLRGGTDKSRESDLFRFSCGKECGRWHWVWSLGMKKSCEIEQPESKCRQPNQNIAR